MTVLYAHLEGFSTLSVTLSPDKAIILLNELIGAFDEAAEQYAVEKLRSMGSTYLAVCGLSVPRIDHTKRTVDFALAMLSIVCLFCQKHGVDLSLDIGIHTGAIAAGVVGKRKFNYDVWGETLNIARKIHESPSQNVIQVSKSVFDALQGMYHFDQVADVPLKGKGKLAVWELTPMDAFQTAVVTNGYSGQFSWRPTSSFVRSGWFGTDYPRLIGRGDGNILTYALTLGFPRSVRER